MNPNILAEILERCNSEDIGERFEALEELWDVIFNQGSPGFDAPTHILVLLNWVRDEHPDWVDILEGICGCALDLAEGPTRELDENARRIELLKVIVGAREVFEEVVTSPCATSEGRCVAHHAAGELLRIALPDRANWLVGVLLNLIRVNPPNHLGLWETIDQVGELDNLSLEDLYLCANQTEIESVRRCAWFHLSSRGDRRGIDELRRSVNALVLPRFAPTAEEAAICVRIPSNVPLDLLTDLYRRAVDLRAIHDLACGILRKVASDDRSGWEVVSESRVDGKLIIRHPNVIPPEVPNSTAALLACQEDLLRKARISRIDTDIWSIFGLSAP